MKKRFLFVFFAVLFCFLLTSCDFLDFEYSNYDGYLYKSNKLSDAPSWIVGEKRFTRDGGNPLISYPTKVTTTDETMEIELSNGSKTNIYKEAISKVGVGYVMQYEHSVTKFPTGKKTVEYYTVCTYDSVKGKSSKKTIIEFRYTRDVGVTYLEITNW